MAYFAPEIINYKRLSPFSESVRTRPSSRITVFAARVKQPGELKEREREREKERERKKEREREKYKREKNKLRDI